MLDPQMKRGLLEVCVLSALCRDDSYGYQLVKDLSTCVEISESTLYPILRRLEASGCVTVYPVEHSGRLRKFYSVTPLGRQRVIEFLSGWGELAAMHQFIEEGVRHG